MDLEQTVDRLTQFKLAKEVQELKRVNERYKEALQQILEREQMGKSFVSETGAIAQEALEE